MNTKTLFSTASVIILLFGLGLTFTPTFMADQYLTNPAWMNDGAKFVAQGWGSHLFAIAAVCWYVRNESYSSGSKAMLLFLVLSNIALIILHTLAVLNGVEKPIGWAQVLLSVVLASWSSILLRQENRAIA